MGTRTEFCRILQFSYWLSEFCDFNVMFILQGVPKTPTTLSMLCRTANWSLFKKEPLSGNALFGCCRASKFENERVSQFAPIRFGVLIQQVCNPSADFVRNVRNHLNVRLHIQINGLVEEPSSVVTRLVGEPSSVVTISDTSRLFSVA